MNLYQQAKHHKTSVLKGFLIVASIGLLIGAVGIFANSEKVSRQEATTSAQALINHTQTLQQIKALDTDIKQAIIELKASNQADHAQTVLYLNCVLVGLTPTSSTSPAPTQAQALVVYHQCLLNAGIDTTNQ